MDQHEILLKLENIEKRFPGVVALKSISLDVRAGEVQVLLGHFERAHFGRRIDGDAERLQRVPRGLMGLDPVDLAKGVARQAAEKDVFRDAQRGDEA